MSAVVIQPADGTFLKTYGGQQSEVAPQFGPLSEAMEWPTLGEAQAVALDINAGTVGTTKPQL